MTSHPRLPNSAHAAHPWMIQQVAPDFELLDAWALPAEGGPGDFDRFLEAVICLDPTRAGSMASRALFILRFRLGRWFGWDDPTSKLPIPGDTSTSLRARLPRELRDSAAGIHNSLLAAHGGAPLYRVGNEAAIEISNATVHGVLHLAWVDQGNGRHRGQMGIYVKPRGPLGSFYVRLIGPFRHLVVYPALTRQVGLAWNARG